MTTAKTIALTIQTFVGKVMSLCFNMLSRFVFLPETLILACDSSSEAFHMMYAAEKLNKQGDNIHP